MSRPVQQHYLPKSAYLSFFEVPTKPGFIYFYQRGQKTILVNVHNVAKERHLYSFVGEDGSYDFEIENILADLETKSKPILNNLNDSQGSLFITAEEKVILSTFISFQVCRTPAFIKTIQDLVAGFMDIYASTFAQNREAFAATVEKMKKVDPAHFNHATDAEELRKFILDGEYEIQPNREYSKAQALKAWDDIFPSILMKKISVLRVDGEVFITSDHPVALVRDPKAPPLYGGGFLMSPVLLPIGRQCTLLLVNDENPPPLNTPDEPVFVPLIRISPHHARQINKYTVLNAEKYLFSSENNNSLKELFGQTHRSKRVQWSNPFRRNRGET